jgi:hypothetical protein
VIRWAASGGAIVGAAMVAAMSACGIRIAMGELEPAANDGGGVDVAVPFDAAPADGPVFTFDASPPDAGPRVSCDRDSCGQLCVDQAATQEFWMCNESGQCRPEPSDCISISAVDAGTPPVRSCFLKKCGDPCDVCAPNSDNCADAPGSTCQGTGDCRLATAVCSP